MALEINSLAKTYSNGVQALKEVSLTVDEGIYGLLGPNGAGKTTFMRVLATLMVPDKGTVTLDGIDVLQSPEIIRQQLGYLPQDFGVYPNVTAEAMLDQLAVFKGFTRYQERRELVAHQLQMVNLYEQRNQKLGTYSGGMRQRFGIAQALLGEPRLIIVDEPTAGLDPTERIRFQNLLYEISTNRILILSTHIVDDLNDLCQNMAIMHHGEIIHQGNPAEMIRQLEGQIWMSPAAAVPEEMPAAITRRMFRGEKYLRVLSADQPGEEFDPVAADLNDVYFAVIRNSSIQNRETELNLSNKSDS